MKEVLKIAGLQTSLQWENPDANRKKLEKQIDEIEGEVDVIVLPEMFTTGFSMKPKSLAEDMNGPTVEWMKKWSKSKNAVITGSIIIKDSERYFNRMLWVEPSGDIQYYDKRHLFTLAGEHKEYTAGETQKVISYLGWKINLNVCYDLRFPVWSRNTTTYDISIYVANWPHPRISAWSTLLRARAIENQSFVVGVNRIGHDANNNEYSGQSAVIDMEGNYLAQAHDKQTTLLATLDRSNLMSFRKRFPFYQDRDDFQLSI